MRACRQWMAVPWGLFFLLLGVRADAQYHVRRITATGTNPVQGVPNGVLFERLPAQGCPPPAETLRLKPAAASLGVPAKLEVEIGACQPNLPAPSVQCQIGVGDRIAEGQFQGWRGTLSLYLPAHILSYPLNLQCSIAGLPESFAGKLYLTYAPPRIPVKQPLENWYRTASEWGAGLGASDPEERVLARLLSGLYNHGQRHWRYGYCEFDAKGGCHFGQTTIPPGSPSLQKFGNLAVCRWNVLVAGDPQCNFTDCFGYSDLFHYIAGTMGVGGLRNEVIEGIHRKGFTTSAELRALDPGAAGNLLCGYRGLNCAFLFGTHDLRKRDGMSYDSTFGQIYRDLGELIAESVVRVNADGVVISTLNNACTVLGGAHYGGFPDMREIPKIVQRCVRDLSEYPSAVFVRPGQGPDAGPVRKLDSIPEAGGLLRVDLEVDVQRAESHLVVGFLSDSLGGEPLRVKGAHRFNSWPHADISAETGLHKATLWFSAEDLAQAEVSGTLWLNAFLINKVGIVDELHDELLPVPRRHFGELPARLEAISKAARVPLDGGRWALRVEVSVDVREPGLFALDARLFSGGNTLSYGGLQSALAPGVRVVPIDFPGEDIAERGIAGFYETSVDLHRLESETRLPLGLLDSLERELGPFDPAESEP